MAKQKPKPEVLAVALGEAKPNPMFSEDQRAMVRFLTFNIAVPCAACGRKSKYHWTQLHSFYAVDFRHPLSLRGLSTRCFHR